VEPRAFTDRELTQRLLRGRTVVWITHKDDKYWYEGSGSVIHRGRRLIITNQHVVQRRIENERGQLVGHEVAPRVQVLFPQPDGHGDWIRDRAHYESLRQGNQGMLGRVLKPTSDDPDLALVQLEGDMPQDCLALQLAPRQAEVGDKVVLVGNSGLSSGLWSLSPGFVKNRVPERRIPLPVRNEQGQVVGEEPTVVNRSWCLETSVPSYHGDSGSPVVNDRGQLVGVHFSGHPKSEQIKFAADLKEVLGFLAKFDVPRDEVVASDALRPAGVVVRELISQVESVDAAVCRKGVEGLARLAPADARRAIPALVRALQRHEDEPLRRTIIEALDLTGPPVPEDLDCLDPAIRMAYKPARLYAVKALAQLGADAGPAVYMLAQALKDRDGDIRLRAVQALRDLGPSARPQAFRALLASASDADEQLAQAALEALCKLGQLTRVEIDLLIEALADNKRWIWVRCFAANRLGLHGPQAAAAIPTLTRALQTTKDDNLLQYAAQALGSIGDTSEPVVKVLLDLVAAQRTGKVRTAVVEALARLAGGLKPDQMTRLRPLLRHADADVSRLALGAILEKKTAAGVESDVAELVKQGDAELAARAMEVLKALGDAARPAVPALVAALPEVPADRRVDAALLLVSIDARQDKVAEAVLPIFLDGLRPSTREDRGAAIRRTRITKALQAMGQPAVEAIFKAFDAVSYSGRESSDHRKNLFVVLAQLGPTCKSQENLNRLKPIRDKELKQGYKDVIGAAQKAVAAMDPR
jgi:HEAT repeat protein